LRQRNRKHLAFLSPRSMRFLSPKKVLSVTNPGLYNNSAQTSLFQMF
jgi:hypothetical protein